LHVLTLPSQFPFRVATVTPVNTQIIWATSTFRTDDGDLCKMLELRMWNGRTPPAHPLPAKKDPSQTLRLVTFFRSRSPSSTQPLMSPPPVTEFQRAAFDRRARIIEVDRCIRDHRRSWSTWP
jgi:hypothetical protein